ncbi:MAG: hypothetical protein FJW36_19955 [Acidobacteria bacterium]|nr:hypothetical protein [Acidobacteriota bacterium]
MNRDACLARGAKCFGQNRQSRATHTCDAGFRRNRLVEGK